MNQTNLTHLNKVEQSAIWAALFIVPFLVLGLLAVLSLDIKLGGPTKAEGSPWDQATKIEKIDYLKKCMRSNTSISYCLGNSVKSGPMNNELSNWNLLFQFVFGLVWPLSAARLAWKKKLGSGYIDRVLVHFGIAGLAILFQWVFCVPQLYLPDINGIAFMFIPILWVIAFFVVTVGYLIKALRAPDPI